MKKIFIYLLLVFSSILVNAQIPAGYYLVPPKPSIGIGKTLQLSVVYVPNRNIPPQESEYSIPPKITWRSSDPNVASVSRGGLVSGVSLGTAKITASFRKQGHSPLIEIKTDIKVDAVLAKIDLPEQMTIPRYCSSKIKAIFRDSDNNQLENRAVSWTVENPQIVSLDILPPNFQSLEDLLPANMQSTGNTVWLKGKQAGQTALTASCEGISKTMTVIVSEATPASLSISPEQMVLDVNESGTALVSALTSEGCRISDLSVNWQITDPTISRIINTEPRLCEIQGLKSGSTSLVASAPNGISSSIDITVPAVAMLRVTPSQIPELDIEKSQTISATTLSGSFDVLRNRSVTWTTSSSSIASIQPTSGYTITVTGKSVGSASIVATCEGINTTIPVTIPAVSSVLIRPPSASIPLGSNKVFQVVLYSSSGTALENRGIRWNASNTNISLSSNSGYEIRVTGQNPGDAQLFATSENVVSSPANIHVRKFCEDNRCVPIYYVDNQKDESVDLYEITCTSSNCTSWVFKITIPSGYIYTRSDLKENKAYKIRVVSQGGNPGIWNDILLDSAPMNGGPGEAAMFQVF